jgi:hypothetical protein
LLLNWFESYFYFKELQRLELEKKVDRFLEWETISLEIDSILLPRQRKHVSKIIDGIISDLKELPCT